MEINYSINPNSKYFLYIDVPYRQSIQHWILGIHGGYGQSTLGRIGHIVMGILKLIPILGHIIAFVDTLYHSRTITQLKLTQTDPYERGLEHGRVLRNQIRNIYDPVLGQIRERNEVLPILNRNSNLNEQVFRFDRQIPENLKQEMRGLAEGSGYSYEDVLSIHCFLDVRAQFGCTSMAVKQTANSCERIAAANHAVSDSHLSDFSEHRRQAFLNAPIPTEGSYQTVLQSAEEDGTIQAMVFDTKRGEITLASRGSYAAHGNFRTFGSNELFDSHEFDTTSDAGIKIFRNLDWPWHFLGQNTIVLTRPQENGISTVSISWPGYIGTLSGMNNRGLSITHNEGGTGNNLDGIPGVLLYTHMLDSCSTVVEATPYLNLHGSSANLIIADKTSAKSFELNGLQSDQQPCLCVGEIR